MDCYWLGAVPKVSQFAETMHNPWWRNELTGAKIGRPALESYPTAQFLGFRV